MASNKLRFEPEGMSKNSQSQKESRRVYFKTSVFNRLFQVYM